MSFDSSTRNDIFSVFMKFFVSIAIIALQSRQQITNITQNRPLNGKSLADLNEKA